MEEVNDAAKQIISKAEPKSWSFPWSPRCCFGNKDSYDYVPAPNVAKKKHGRCRGSMVGGMVWALSQNKNLKEVIRWGVACGSAATDERRNPII
jgi:6-phosphofructokinase 2